MLLRKHKTLVVHGIVFLVSCMSAFFLYITVDRPNYEERLALHNQIIHGTAPSPYKYRLLVPNLTELVSQLGGVILPPKKAFLLSYALYDLIAFLFLFGTLFWFLKFWFNEEKSLLGILIVGSTIPLALQDQYYQPWSYLEVGLFALSLGLIYVKRFSWLAIVIVVASLNRETAVFIPLAYLFANVTFEEDGLFGIGWAPRCLGQILCVGSALVDNVWRNSPLGRGCCQGDLCRGNMA